MTSIITLHFKFKYAHAHIAIANFQRNSLLCLNERKKFRVRITNYQAEFGSYAKVILNSCSCRKEQNKFTNIQVEFHKFYVICNTYFIWDEQVHCNTTEIFDCIFEHKYEWWISNVWHAWSDFLSLICDIKNKPPIWMPFDIVHNHQVWRNPVQASSMIKQPKLVYDDIRSEFTYSFSNIIEIKDKRYFVLNTASPSFSFFALFSVGENWLRQLRILSIQN